MTLTCSVPVIAFYLSAIQPSKGEMIVLLHFHLKVITKLFDFLRRKMRCNLLSPFPPFFQHPVIIGKKKHKDIQFYTEVGMSDF